MAVTKLDARQTRYRALLQTLGLAADSTADAIIAATNKELDYPLRPRTGLPDDANLYFSSATTASGDGATKVLGAIKKIVYTAPTGLSINFQARTVSNASYFDVIFPASTVGRFRRCALFFNRDGKIQAVFSAESVTQGALVNAGTLIPTSNCIPLGYVDLVCTNALGSFKSATAGPNVIQDADLYRFAPGAGGSGGSGTTMDVDQVGHGFTVLTPIYFNGTSWVAAQANAAGTLASYIVTEVPDADSFTAANFGVFEIPNALTPGQYYFCSDTVAGGITITEPPFGYSNPVLFCESATLIHAMVHRPSAFGDGIVSDSEIGAITAFPTTAVPVGYLYCNGVAVSRVTYADLFNIIGTTYGPGDGSTTFNLPDYRGYFLRGRDNGRGIDPDAAGRVSPIDNVTVVGDVNGSVQPDQFGSHNHGTAASTNSNSIPGTIPISSTDPADYNAPSTFAGGNETRPKNMYVSYFIRWAARGAIKGESVPTGCMQIFAGPLSQLPSSYLACDGSSLLRADFPKLFAAIGTAWGAADGTHFNLPDMRGMFPRGVANGQTTDPDRAARTAQHAGGNTGDNVGSLQPDDVGPHGHSQNVTASVGGGFGGNATGNTPFTTSTNEILNPYASGGLTRQETRPKNVYVNYIIKV